MARQKQTPAPLRASHPCSFPTPTASRRRGPGTSRRAIDRVRADGGAEQSDTLFWEPGEPLTRAPNLRTLGQGRRARQDLVHNSESSAKCGDSGEEKRPRTSIGDSGGIPKWVAPKI